MRGLTHDLSDAPRAARPGPSTLLLQPYRSVLAADDQTVGWRLLGWLFVLAGALTLSASLLSQEAGGAATSALSAGALVVGVIVLRRPLPHGPVVPAGLALGVTMITVAAALADPMYILFPSLYVWVGVESALLLSIRATLGLGAVTALAYGTLLAAADIPAGDAAAHWIAMVGSMTVLGGMAWVLRLRSDRLVADLADAASTDPLTGLLNRRGYRRMTGRLMADAIGGGRHVTVVLGDIDRFKALNDEHGHETGDDAIVALATLLRAAIGERDLIARIDGDAFALVLADTDGHAALLVAERLRRELTQHLATRGTPATASFGVATSPGDALSADTLLDCATVAVAAAKALGRDRTVVYSAQLADELRLDHTSASDDREHLQAVLVLAETLDLRHHDTARHSQVVGYLAAITATRLGFSEPEVARIRLAGILHDVGKVAVPDAVLDKPGRLTDEEYHQVKQHSEVGARILEGANLRDLSRWVLAHHERPDGSGYPAGLRGEDIPVQSRILAVADAFEAMTAGRVYRPAVGLEAAGEELRRHAGRQFDADIVDAFLSALADASLAPVRRS
ncbi:MAG: diguanylate cyclase [Solirubrobacterales bacterium]|nr:diguanylate cyclase [Solirubrobacterales bacterium]